MEKDEKATTRVQEILGKMRENLKVSKAGQKSPETALHIRGMDALSTKQDVIQAVERIVGPLTGKAYKVSDLRPNMGNTQAATLVVNEAEARKILTAGKLRVGYVSCKVERRIALNRCYKCWAYTHKASECKSEQDRTRCCYRCGEEGHVAKACKKEEACPICNERGHMSDTRRCKVFRKALQSAREEGRKTEDEISGGSKISLPASVRGEVLEDRPREEEETTGEPDDPQSSDTKMEEGGPKKGPGRESLVDLTQT